MTDETHEEIIEVFSWLHLSDIHLLQPPTSARAEQALVLDALRSDLNTLVSQGRSVDAIIISGDLAFSGGAVSSSEYESAKSLISQIQLVMGVPDKAVFMVPGNHDVDLNEGLDDPFTKRLLADLRDRGSSIDEVLASESELRLLLKRQESYEKFAAFYAPACRRGKEKVLAGSWVFRFYTPAGVMVRLVGLNSALLTAKEDDRGKLQMGMIQVSRSFVEPPVAEDEIVISMSHHPLTGGWLRDEKKVGRWIRRHSRVHLSGHVHEQEFEQTIRGYGENFVSIGAGAVHDSTDSAAMGYSIGALVKQGAALGVRLWPRMWSTRSHRFVADTEICSEGEQSVEFDVGQVAVLPHVKGVPPLLDGRSVSHHPVAWEDLEIHEVKEIIEDRLDMSVEVCASSATSVTVVFRQRLTQEFGEVKAVALGCAMVLSETKRDVISIGFYNTAAVDRDTMKGQVNFCSFQFNVSDVQAVSRSKSVNSEFWRKVGFKYLIRPDISDEQLNVTVTDFEEMQENPR